MRIFACSIFGVILIFLIICRSAFATMCNDFGHDQIQGMKELYKYALIAQAPKMDSLEFMQDCVSINGNVIAERPMNISQIKVPQKFIDLVVNRADNRQASMERQNDGKSFFVRCTAKRNQSILIEMGFKILVRILGDRVIFYLTGTEVKGEIFDRNNGEPIIVIPGTDLSRVPQIRANIEGEKCVFPVVKMTVDVLCDALRKGEASKIYRAIVEANSHLSLSQKKRHKLTIIGHSLGGSATQYVALNLPAKCKPNGRFEGFDAYAFASPGLDNQERDNEQLEHLHGYFISSDLLLRKIFSERFQSGNLAIFTPSINQNFGTGHFINEVQSSICFCLQGMGRINESSGSRRNCEILIGVNC